MDAQINISKKSEEGPPKRKSLKKNYIYNVIYQLFIIIIPLITAPYIARVLQPEGVGQYSYASSLISYFTAFAALGFGTYAQREIARCRDDKSRQSIVFWEIVICRLVPVAIALAVNLALCFTNVFGNYMLLMLINSISVVAVAVDLSFVFQGNEEFGSLVLRNVVVRIIGIILIFILVKNPSHVWLYALINVSASLLGNVLMIPYLRKLLVRVPFNVLKPFRHISGTLKLFIPTIATTVYLMVDRTLIGSLISETTTVIVDGVETVVRYADLENGYYEQSEKIIKMAMTVVTCISTVMITRNSYEVSHGHLDAVKNNVYKSCRLTWCLGIPMVLGIVAIAPNMVPWFFGLGYEKCIILMSLLAPLILIIGFSGLFLNQLIAPMGKDYVFWIYSLTGITVNVILNLVLIPKLWALGAVIATLIAETVVTIELAIFSAKEIKITKVLLMSWKYLIAGGVMFVVVFFTAQLFLPSWWGTLVLVLIGIAAYFLMLIILQDSLLNKLFASLFRKFRKKAMTDALELKDNFAKCAAVPSRLVYGELIENPDFTLCIPVYGYKDCLKDLFKNLNNQSKANILVQIVVSDNKKYPGDENKLLEFIKQQNIPNLAYFLADDSLGQLNNFNRCIELSASEFLGMVHDDDLLVSNYFQIVEAILPFLQKHTDVGIIHCKYQNFTEFDFDPIFVERSGFKRISQASVTRTGQSGAEIPSCGMIFNKEIAQKCGGFNDDYYASGDAFLGAVMMEHGYKVMQFTEITGYYRLGLNASINTRVCQDFIVQDDAFMCTWWSRNLYRKIYMKLFWRYLYSKNIDHKVEVFGKFNDEITVENLDFKNAYKTYGKLNFIVFAYKGCSLTIKIFNKLFTKNHKLKVGPIE